MYCRLKTSNIMTNKFGLIYLNKCISTFPFWKNVQGAVNMNRFNNNMQPPQNTVEKRLSTKVYGKSFISWILSPNLSLCKWIFCFVYKYFKGKIVFKGHNLQLFFLCLQDKFLQDLASSITGMAYQVQNSKTSILYIPSFHWFIDKTAMHFNRYKVYSAQLVQ